MGSDAIVTFGCVALIVSVCAACLLSAALHLPDEVGMRRCAEACGPGRMARYTSTECQCEAP